MSSLSAGRRARDDSVQRQRPKRTKRELDDEERGLEDFVFGGGASNEQHDEAEMPEERVKDEPEEQAAWADEDDEEEEQKDLKRKSYLNTQKSAAWLQKTEEKEEESSEGLWGQGSASLVDSSSSRLPSGRLDFERVTSVNQQDKCKGVCRALSFHPSGQLCLTGALDHTLRLFNVDGEDNPKIHSVYFEGFPIYEAGFSPDGKEVLLTSQRAHYFTYDLASAKATRSSDRIGTLQGKGADKMIKSFVYSPDGKFLALLTVRGFIMILSNATKQWICNFEVAGTILHAAFSPDSKTLYATGGGGQVFVWDMGTRRCVHKFTDPGNISLRKMAMSPNGKYFVTGSESGVVNVYDSSELTKKNPRPLTELSRLTTEVTGLKFNHDSQILATLSSYDRNQIRLVHVPSFTTFANFPIKFLPKHNYSMDFSPHSGFFAVGDDSGDAKLFRLKHYTTA